MPTVAAPQDQSVEIVEIDNLARAAMMNGVEALDIQAYLNGRNKDRAINKLYDVLMGF